MKNVLLFSWFYLPYIGGSELFIDAVTRRLSDRFRFFIVTARRRRDLPPREDLPDATILRVGPGWSLDKFLYPLPAVRRALSLPDVDLVHAVMVNAAAVAARSYLSLKRRPSLLTLQSGDSEDYVRNYMGPVFPLYRKLHRSFGRVHAISSFLRDRAVGYGCDPASITVIPNGVDTEAFTPAPDDEVESDGLRSRLGLEGKRVIVSVSRLAEKNSVGDLIRAMPSILTSHPNAALLLVGDGEDRARLESLAAELSVGRCVRFAGAVAHPETAHYLRLGEVFARPSVSEGLGTAFLEAMACELPVVASPVGGITDFLKDGDAGLFCEPGRPDTVAAVVARLLESPDLRRSLGARGRKLVLDRYHWDRVAKRLGALYEELLAS